MMPATALPASRDGVAVSLWKREIEALPRPAKTRKAVSTVATA